MSLSSLMDQCVWERHFLLLSAIAILKCIAKSMNAADVSGLRNGSKFFILHACHASQDTVDGTSMSTVLLSVVISNLKQVFPVLMDVTGIIPHTGSRREACQHPNALNL